MGVRNFLNCGIELPQWWKEYHDPIYDLLIPRCLWNILLYRSYESSRMGLSLSAPKGSRKIQPFVEPLRLLLLRL